MLGGTLLFTFGCGNESSDDDSTGGGAGTGGSGAGTGGTGASGGSSGSSAGSSLGGSSGAAAGTAQGGGAGSGALSGSGGGGMSAAGGTAAGMAGTAMGGAGAAGGGTPEWGIEMRPTGQTCKVVTPQSAQPALLSATGCVDPMAPTQPAATLIAYDVATPLWSDGAEKHRYFALPDTGTIHVKDCSGNAPECEDPQSGGGNYEDEGDWDFPDGTVFVKTFGFEGKLVETRLLMKRDQDNWWGFSYQWREDQSDADLLGTEPDGYDAMVPGPDGMVNWHFPSRGQCLQCHVTAAGVSLGPETSQLNFDFTYPNGAKGNQIDTLEHAGVFEAKPPMLPVYPTPEDTTATLEERARSYLHINCGICHRPGGNFADFDARFSTAFEDTGLCGTTPDKAVLPEYMLDDPKRLDPGHPENSVVSLRMHSLDSTFRMPQVGSRVVDPTGSMVVDDWISSLTACP